LRFLFYVLTTNQTFEFLDEVHFHFRTFDHLLD
jgi:hypothetical protein